MPGQIRRSIISRSPRPRFGSGHPPTRIDDPGRRSSFTPTVPAAPNDPDLKLMLERHACAHPSAPAHFVVTPKTDAAPKIADLIRRTHNLQCTTYSPNNHHAELVAIFTELIGPAEAVRREIQQTGDGDLGSMFWAAGICRT